MDEMPTYAPVPESEDQKAEARSAAELMRRAAHDLELYDSTHELSDEAVQSLVAWLRSAAEDAEQIGADFRALAFVRTFLDNPVSGGA